MVLIAFNVVTGEDLDASTEVMSALVNLQAQEQAKGAEVKENSNKGIVIAMIVCIQVAIIINFYCITEIIHTCSYLVHPRFPSFNM